MKKELILIVFYLSLLSCSHSSDEPQPVSELDKLPAATQTGTNKIGCLIDGKAFLPGNYNNSTNCFYQFVDGGYYFHVSLNNHINNYLYGVALNTNKLEIHQNDILNLFENEIGNASAFYTFETLNSETTHTYTGKLTITKLDTVNHIVSGTFWFDILDTYGIVHQIRDGRFDMLYTN